MVVHPITMPKGIPPFFMGRIDIVLQVQQTCLAKHIPRLGFNDTPYC
jgi:hypothetical protein